MPLLRIISFRMSPISWETGRVKDIKNPVGLKYLTPKEVAKEPRRNEAVELLE